jgi:hypothetical protein
MQGEQMDGVIPRALKYMFGKVRESTGQELHGLGVVSADI